MQNKIIFGLDNIHICKDDNGTPIPIKGAVSVEIEISSDITYAYIQNRKVPMATDKQARGRLVVVGLSQEELATLLGYEQDSNGGILVDEGLNAPQYHLLFSQQTASGDMMLYHVFRVRFSLPSVSGKTIEEGNIDFNEVVLDLDIEYDNDYKGYYYMKKSNGNDTNGWFGGLHYPTNKNITRRW